MSSFHRRVDVPGLAGKLEHAVAVAVESDGDAPALNQAPHQHEVASRVLLGTEHRVGYDASGVVHRQQQGEVWTLLSQPGVKAAVDLYHIPA